MITDLFYIQGYCVESPQMTAANGHEESQGIVMEVRAYNRASGLLVGKALSQESDGYYHIPLKTDDLVYVVAYNPNMPRQLLQLKDGIKPATINDDEEPTSEEV